MDVITKYLPTLKPYALKLTHNIQDAEDLLQEVAEKILKSNIGHKPSDEQEKICYRSVYFVFIDMKRRQNRRLKDDLTGSIAISEEAAVYMKLELDNAMEALELINPIFKTALLATIFGYSGKEISNATGEMINTIRTQVFYGRRAIASHLKHA